MASLEWCLVQEEVVATLEVDPVLECRHTQEEQCHVTHLTSYEPSLEQVRGRVIIMMMIMTMMEQVCRDNFEKSCQISFRPEVSRETATNESRASGHVTQYSPPIGQVRRESVRVCSRPLVRTCNGQGPEVCTVQYETACTTRYSDTRAWSSSSYQHVTCVQASGGQSWQEGGRDQVRAAAGEHLRCGLLHPGGRAGGVRGRGGHN